MSVLKFKDPVTKEWREITTIVGPQGPQGIPGPAGKDGTVRFEELTDAQKETIRGPQGIQGPAGKDYVLTANDKAEIAQLTLAAMPQAEEGAY